MQKRLRVSVFLLNPLELPHNADAYAETTMRFCFSAKPPGNSPITQTHMRKRLCASVSLLKPLEVSHNTDAYANPMELRHNADAYAETTIRFCFFC